MMQQSLHQCHCIVAWDLIRIGLQVSYITENADFLAHISYDMSFKKETLHWQQNGGI